MSTENISHCPDAKRVAKRALVLSAVVCRSFSDHSPKDPDAIDLWHRLTAWVDSLRLDNEIEPHERAIISAPLGSLQDVIRIQGTWRTESLAILAWSLGLFSFPTHDTQVNPYEVTDSLSLLNPAAADVIESAQLRSHEELLACRELYYAIHCRLREFERELTRRDIRHWIDNEWVEALRIDIDQVLDDSGDLLIQGIPVAQVTKEIRSSCESMIYDRHLAAIWLAGECGPLFSAVTVDT